MKQTKKDKNTNKDKRDGAEMVKYRNGKNHTSDLSLSWKQLNVPRVGSGHELYIPVEWTGLM